MTKRKTKKRNSSDNGQAHEVINEPAVEQSAGSSDDSIPLVTNFFLLPDNTADSPFEEFPGSIIMPAIMTMDMHQEFSKLVAESPQEIKEISVFSVAGQKRFIMVSEMHYRIAFAFGKITINLGDLPVELNADNYGKLPATLAAFIGCVGLEWQRRHTQFPGFRGNDMEISS